MTENFNCNTWLYKTLKLSIQKGRDGIRNKGQFLIRIPNIMTDLEQTKQAGGNILL